MKKGALLFKCSLLAVCTTVTGAFAQNKLNTAGAGAAVAVAPKQEKPIDAFIRHVGETNKFVEVSNIWMPDNTFDKTELLQNVAKVQPLTIDYTALAALIQKNPIAISLVVPGVDGGTYTIDLAQYSPLHNDFKVYADAGNGNVTQVDYEPGKYYSGIVHGIPGSVAGFSFFKNEVYGIFSIPNVGNFVLVPNSLHGLAYNSLPSYILYNDVDLKILDKAPKCAADQLDFNYSKSFTTAGKTTTTLNNDVYQNCKEVNLLEVGDFSYYQSKGSNMTNCTNYLSAMMNNQATIYRNESIILNLKAVKINTATDIYKTLASSSSAYLNAFGDDIQNTYRTTYGCNLAMLLTCTHNSSMGGVAWVGVMCQNYSSSSHVDGTAISNIDSNSSLASPVFPTYSWNVEVLSHEMGHNVGSYHTHACWWNPQYGGSTGIDGCYAVAGGSMDVIGGGPSCSIPTPSTPGSAGGTIMSYCHLVSGVGINFTNGFGPQPGIVIRNYINGTSPAGYDNAPTGCVTSYYPDSTLNTPNVTVAANRECTDMTSGITYYWNDNNTATHSDDVLVLMIKKNGNTIGDLNTTGFSVSTNTIVRYSSGTGDTLSFPSGMPGILAQNYGMRRYWKITPTSAPSSNVEVMYPFLSADTADVHGSVSLASAPLSNYYMYKVNSPIDPNPYNGFPGSSSSSFTLYSYNTSASATQWSLSTTGTGGQTKLAHMLMTDLAGGGTGFYTFCTPHPAPTMAAMPADPCPGTTATYSVNPDISALSYVWTVSGGGWSGSSTSSSIVATAGSGTGTITVRAVDSCGSGNSTTFTVSPAPLATATIAPNTDLCVGFTSAGFTATPTGGSPTSYSWNVTGTGWSIASGGTGSSITVNAGTGVGVITVNGINACGPGPTTTYNASMTATAPPAPTSITPPALACPSSTSTFTAATSPGASLYTWSVAGAGWSGTSFSNAINVMVGTGTGTLTVTASNSCGTSSAYSQVFIPSTAPGAATSVSTPLLPCSGTSATLTTPAIPSASSYSWVVTGTGWSGSSSANSINVLVGTGTATISVTPVNACGAGTPYTTTVTPIIAPSSSFAVSSHIVETHADVVAFYTGSAPSGSTFTWSFPGGVGTPGTGSGAQTVHWNAAGQYLIFLNVSSGSGCTSATADTIRVINPAGVNDLNTGGLNANILPNPNNGTFDIMFDETITDPITVKLFDMQGRIVYHKEYMNGTLNKKVSVETQNLAAGGYAVYIYTNNSTVVKQIAIFK